MDNAFRKSGDRQRHRTMPVDTLWECWSSIESREAPAQKKFQNISTKMVVSVEAIQYRRSQCGGHDHVIADPFEL